MRAMLRSLHIHFPKFGAFNIDDSYEVLWSRANIFFDIIAKIPLILIHQFDKLYRKIFWICRMQTDLFISFQFGFVRLQRIQFFLYFCCFCNLLIDFIKVKLSSAIRPKWTLWKALKICTGYIITLISGDELKFEPIWMEMTFFSEKNAMVALSFVFLELKFAYMANTKQLAKCESGMGKDTVFSILFLIFA